MTDQQAKDVALDRVTTWEMKSGDPMFFDCECEVCFQRRHHCRLVHEMLARAAALDPARQPVRNWMGQTVALVTFDNEA
jgi:siroheme synthase